MTNASRILALDLGRARIGVAITDGLGLTVQPLLTIYRKEAGRRVSRADIKSIGRIIRKHAVAEIVVGHPLQISGEVGPQAARAQKFAAELHTEFNIPVHLWDERLTTHAAHEILDQVVGSTRTSPERNAADRIDRKRIVDQLAAVLILESFLTSRRENPGLENGLP